MRDNISMFVLSSKWKKKRFARKPHEYIAMTNTTFFSISFFFFFKLNDQFTSKTQLRLTLIIRSFQERERNSYKTELLISCSGFPRHFKRYNIIWVDMKVTLFLPEWISFIKKKIFYFIIFYRSLHVYSSGSLGRCYNFYIFINPIATVSS